MLISGIRISDIKENKLLLKPITGSEFSGARLYPKKKWLEYAPVHRWTGCQRVYNEGVTWTLNKHK